VEGGRHAHRLGRLRRAAVGALELLLRLPYFSRLAHPGQPSREVRDRGWWTASSWASCPGRHLSIRSWSWAWSSCRQRRLAPGHHQPNLVWALLTPPSPDREPDLADLSAALRHALGPSILLALAVVAIGYAALALADALFKIDSASGWWR